MLRCPRWPRSKSNFTNARHSTVAARGRHSDALTLLHKTIGLIPRALPSSAKLKAKYPAESLEFWNDVLSTQYQDLNSHDGRAARVAVYAADQWANSEDLVTALLDDPLASNATTSGQLKDRWKSFGDSPTLTIRSHNTPSSDSTTFSSTSSYLRQFDVAVEVTELKAPTTHNRHELAIPEDVTQTLLEADVAVIVCNPLTIPIQSLLQHAFVKNPKTILVFTCNPSPEVADLIRCKFQHSCKDPHSSRPYPGPYIIFADPSRAVAANAILKSDSKSALAVQRYQDNFVVSQVSHVTDRIQRRFGSPDSKIDSIRNSSALATVHAAIATALASLRSSRDEVENVFADVNHLNDKMEEARAKVPREVFGSAADGKNAITEAFKRATKDIKPVMDRLTWWRLPWAVDDTSATVSAALDRIFCPDLEKRLILHAGRLSVLQADLTSSTFKLLSKYSETPFHSAILSNTLNQLSSAPSYPMTPSTLTQPIANRRAQVIQHPTLQLHVAGQRALLGMAGSTATGAGITWAGWVGWIAGNGDGLLGVIGLDAGMSIGVGALIGLAGIRWGIRRWEKAKRRWFEDWNRIGDGLERDLEASLDRTMKEKVVLVAETGCKHLLETAKKRKQEIAMVKDDADMLLDALEEAQKLR